MVLNVIFNNIFQLYHGGRFCWWRKPEKTTDLPQITDKLFELATLVVIDIDCTGSCKINYHTITTTTTASSKILLPDLTMTTTVDVL